MEYKPLEKHIGHEATRDERIEELKKYFNHKLVEDGVDGTTFDIAVSKALDQVLEDNPEK